MPFDGKYRVRAKTELLELIIFLSEFVIQAGIVEAGALCVSVTFSDLTL